MWPALSVIWLEKVYFICFDLVPVIAFDKIFVHLLPYIASEFFVFSLLSNQTKAIPCNEFDCVTCFIIFDEMKNDIKLHLILNMKVINWKYVPNMIFL